jgi:hypothetical protein
MLVKMIKCDNPKCKSVEAPEWVDDDDPTKYTGPYGWIDSDICFVGSGPNLHVDACSVACLSPAVKDLLAAWEDKEREEMGG